MDQEKETEKTRATDSAVLKEDVPSAVATGNTSGKPEKVEESSEASDNVHSSADKAMEPSDEPQDQPTSVETPNQPSSEEPSGDMHSTERSFPEKTLDQPSSENTPGQTQDQTSHDQTANQPPNTNDDKSGKDPQPLGDESSTKETKVNPAPIKQGAEEQKPTGEESEGGQHSVSEQDPNANDQVSSSNTATSPEQLTPGVQEVPIADGLSAKATEAKDTAVSNSVDPNEETEEQSPTVNIKEIGESSVKVGDSADTELPAEATSQQPEANLDNLQKTPSVDDTIAKPQVPTDHQPNVESIPNKDEDDTKKVQKEETPSPDDKDDVQGESPVESKIETEDKTTKSQDEERDATPEKQDGGKESLNAPVEEAAHAPVEEIGTTDKVDTEGPRLRSGKATEEDTKVEKEPEEEIQEEGGPGAKGGFSNVRDQERKEGISDVLSDLQDSLNSPVVCGLVVFALLVLIVILRCLFSLNAICYFLLYYSVLIIFGYPLTLCMVRNNLDRSVIRVVVGVFCLLFSILFYKCRPTITWMTEISELL